MKKLLFTLAILFTITAFTSCEPTSLKEDGNTAQSIDKPKIKRPGNGG